LINIVWAVFSCILVARQLYTVSSSLERRRVRHNYTHNQFKTTLS